VAEGTVPGKTLEYLRSGRPVLYVGPGSGETPDLLRETGGAVTAGSHDQAAITSALRALMDGEDPPPADNDRLARYSRKAQTARLADRLREVVA
jgi:hypothetical protein